MLCAQVHGDLARLGLLDRVVEWIRGELAAAGDSPVAGTVARALGDVEAGVRASLAASELCAPSFRRLLEQLTRVVQASCLVHEAAVGASEEKSAVAALFVEEHLVTKQVSRSPESLQPLVDAVIGDDVSC